MRALLLLVAGVAGGMLGTAGGITSLISYPALLAVGIAPRAANIANLVAVVGCLPGSALASREELSGQRRWLGPWLVVSALGAAAGSLLVLTTSDSVFVKVVPALVLASAVALVLQARRPPRDAARVPSGRERALLRTGLIAISVYNGYFGAGSGVMTLALLLATRRQSLPVANALKNVLVGVAAIVSAVVFVVLGHVDWTAALPLGAGMFAGGLLGPRITRRAPVLVVRWVIAALAVVLAVELWINPTL